MLMMMMMMMMMAAENKTRKFLNLTHTTQHKFFKEKGTKGIHEK